MFFGGGGGGGGGGDRGVEINLIFHYDHLEVVKYLSWKEIVKSTMDEWIYIYVCILYA